MEGVPVGGIAVRRALDLKVPAILFHLEGNEEKEVPLVGRSQMVTSAKN